MARIVPPYPASRRQFVNDVVVTSKNAIFMGGCFTCGFNGVDNTGTLIYKQAIAEDASENVNYGGGVSCPDGLYVEVTESGAGNQQGTILAHWNT